MLSRNIRNIIKLTFHNTIAGLLIALASLALLKRDFELSLICVLLFILVAMYIHTIMIQVKLDERFDRLEEFLKKLSRKESGTDKAPIDSI